MYSETIKNKKKMKNLLDILLVAELAEVLLWADEDAQTYVGCKR